MALLKTPNTSPPGGFKYVQSETKLTIVGDSLQDLTAKVVSHRKYKGLKPDDTHTVGHEIQRQICTRLGNGECKPEAADVWVPVKTTKRFSLSDILAFSKAMIEFAKSGASMAPMDEAQRRRKICADCPINQRAVGCKCSLFYKAVDAALPKERRFHDMHICGICNCSNAVKVNMPVSVLLTESRDLSFPVHCWLPEILAKK